MQVKWPMSRGLIPEMPPQEIVPAAARPALLEVDALRDRQRHLQARQRDIPGERRDAAAEYQRKSAYAIRQGNEPAKPVRVHELDDELVAVVAEQPGIGTALREAAVDFANVLEPLLPGARQDAIRETKKALTKLAKLADQLDAQVDAIRHSVGVAKWATVESFSRTPRFLPSQEAALVEAARAVRAEHARLSTWVEAEQTATPKIKAVTS